MPATGSVLHENSMNTENPATNRPTMRAVCTVSAAALMLGASQAATVGLHFQPDWSTTASQYTGYQVTATAFGVAPESWQNLTPLPTGYNNSDNPGPYTLSEIINTTTTTNGLHALPSGSLSITWSASAANTSGFGDASNGGSYGGNHPHRGDQEVLYGFLRDDVFIYTNPNNAIPYSVQISGLKSVFTSGPYVIELIATTDSGTGFTNAIVTAQSGTQNLTYTATQATLGILGGASSVSTPLDDDSITITGAPAFKDGNTNDLASTISGIILTQGPVITKSASAPVAPVTSGSTVNLGITAIGVPPLSYQWRLNGSAIPGATSASYTVASLVPTNSGFYDVVVSNAYGSATNPPVPVTADILIGWKSGLFADSKTQGTPHAAWSKGAKWQAGAGSHSGVAVFDSSVNPAITIPGETDLTGATNGTVAFWMKSSGDDTGRGYHGAVLFEQGRGTFRVDVQDQNQGSAGTVDVNVGGTSVTSVGTVDDGSWHHIAVSYDQSGNGNVTVYIDGVLDSQVAGGAWAWATGQPFNLGQINDSYWEIFNGSLDDVRLYNRILTDSEVVRVASTGAVVDPAALQLQLTVTTDSAEGLGLYWSNGGNLQSSATANGPYTDVLDTSSPWGYLPTSKVDFFRTKQ